MNDTEIAALLGRLDRLHDMLVEEGYYTKANSAYLAKEAIASLHEQLVEAQALVAAAISRAEYHADRNTTAADVFRDISALATDQTKKGEL